MPSTNPHPTDESAPSLTVVILAAGAGTRMRSILPKPLHELGGRPLVAYALRAAEVLHADTTVIVVGHHADDVMGALGDAYLFATQIPQRGTAHAVEVAMPHIPIDASTVLVLFSDTPLVRDETLRSLLDMHHARHAKVTLLTACVGDPAAYGRIVRDHAGRVVEIVEARMATPEQLKMMEINSGVCCFDAAWLRAMLPRVEENASGERYLTDLVAMALHEADGEGVWPVAAITTTETEAMGINDCVQLAEAEEALRQRTLRRLDTDCGPFSHLRTGAVIREGAHIGNFVEVKQSVIGPHTAVGHFSYLGDAAIGAHVNIAAGTITANYDGTREKKRTEIGDNAFIGCGTILRAPVRIGPDAATGAGAVVTHDVAEGMLVAGVPARPMRPADTRHARANEE
ncbi:MAG: NTP transferase domain-containing protein [Thermomicrobia bacterium]|nr:NTP transferase domain-containing protein [Thermomicrobia bacterium]